MERSTSGGGCGAVLENEVGGDEVAGAVRHRVQREHGGGADGGDRKNDVTHGKIWAWLRPKHAAVRVWGTLVYSARRASMALMRVARREGSQQASSATEIRESVVTTRINGLLTRMPRKAEASAEVTA